MRYMLSVHLAKSVSLNNESILCEGKKIKSGGFNFSFLYKCQIEDQLFFIFAPSIKQRVNSSWNKWDSGKIEWPSDYNANFSQFSFNSKKKTYFEEISHHYDSWKLTAWPRDWIGFFQSIFNFIALFCLLLYRTLSFPLREIKSCSKYIGTICMLFNLPNFFIKNSTVVFRQFSKSQTLV